MPLKIGNIEVYLGPQEQGAPDSLITPIVDFINSAKPRQKLMIAIQEVDNRAIAEAIVDARLRGVTVQAIIEQSYLLSARKPKDRAAAFALDGEARDINRSLFSAILRSTGDIKVDFNPNIFHQKFIVLGNSVLTGSTNFTDTGVTKNLNHVVIVHDAKVANAYKKEFAEIRRGRFGKESIEHGDAPQEVEVSKVRVKPLFAPDHGPEMEIMKQILKAKQRIDFAAFTFAQSSGIDDALIAAHNQGIAVNGVLDMRQANQKWAAKSSLQQAGIDVKVAGGNSFPGKLHHKLMVIDDQLTIFGSFNYTKPANKLNDENVLIIGDVDETKAISRRRQGQIGLAARQEIDRIISDFGS